MHQPITLANEEGVSFFDGEVVHALVGIEDYDDLFDRAGFAIKGDDLFADF